MDTETVKEAKPIIFYTCHVCAIEVPAAFASEHIASIKHQANARIASEAARRTRALICALPPPSDEQLNAQFCVHCSTIISRKHYKTKKHRVAVLQDKMLKALMAVYIGDDDDTVNSTDISDHTNEDLIKEKSDENNIDTEGHDSLEMKNSKDSETCKIHEKIQSTTVEDNDQVMDNDFNVIEIKKNNTDCNSVDDDKVKNKIIDIEIGNIQTNNRLRYSIETCNKIRENMECRARETQVAADRSKTAEVNLEYDDFVPHINKFVKVASDHYHSFVREGGKIGKMRCVVCDSTFLCDDALSRAFSIRHLLPKTMSLFDEQDVTKINDIYSYCNICNNLLKNEKLYDHIVTSHHLMNKAKKASSDTLRQTIANANVDEKRVKDAKVETVSQNTHDNVKDQATNSKEKVKNIDKYRKLIEDVFPNNTSENEVYNAAGSSEVKYKHPGEVFENNALEEIVKNTARSSKNVSKFLGEVFDNNTPKDKAQNTNKNIGAKKLQLGTLGYPFEVTDDEKVVHCVICDCKVPNVQETKKLHLTGNKHVTNAKDIKKVTGTYEITQQGNNVRCTICNCYVPNTAKNREEHIRGPKHAANVEKKRSQLL